MAFFTLLNLARRTDTTVQLPEVAIAPDPATPDVRIFVELANGEYTSPAQEINLTIEERAQGEWRFMAGWTSKGGQPDRNGVVPAAPSMVIGPGRDGDGNVIVARLPDRLRGSVRVVGSVRFSLRAEIPYIPQ